jgi:hypothetical protein
MFARGLCPPLRGPLSRNWGEEVGGPVSNPPGMFAYERGGALLDKKRRPAPWRKKASGAISGRAKSDIERFGSSSRFTPALYFYFVDSGSLVDVKIPKRFVV